MTLHRLAHLGLATVITFAAATSASAQRGNGYLFHAPEATLSLRLGYDHANANSDLFDQVTQDLTLNRRDFSGVTAGAEIAIPATSRLEFALDASYSHSAKGSEFRHFIDNKNLPIEQTTSFDRVPITVIARFYLTSPGRSVGQLAWIPARFTPWVAVGGGTMWYRFKQDGDFVDFNNNNVYPATYESTAWTTVGTALAGVDVNLNSHMALRSSVRGLWARAPLTHDFSGFEKLDLSGVNGTVGLSFRM